MKDDTSRSELNEANRPGIRNCRNGGRQWREVKNLRENKLRTRKSRKLD